MVVQNMSRLIDFTLHTAGMRKMVGQCDILENRDSLQ